MVQPTILIVGTPDTKLDEILYLRNQILAEGACNAKILNVSHTLSARVKKLLDNAAAGDVISPLEEHSSALKDLSRGEYIDKAIELGTPVVKQLVSKSAVQGIVSAAGSSGSSLATAFMR